MINFEQNDIRIHKKMNIQYYLSIMQIFASNMIATREGILTIVYKIR